jgi:ATP-dependent DNA helicase RecG
VHIGGEGGAIVVGVRDRAPTRELAIPGVSDRVTPDQVTQAIFERTSPAITVRPVVRRVDGKVVLVLIVPRGAAVHSTTSGVYKIRVGSHCKPLAGDQLRGLRALREHYDWTAEPSGFGVDGLSRAALERAASLLRRAGADDLAQDVTSGQTGTGRQHAGVDGGYGVAGSSTHVYEG